MNAIAEIQVNENFMSESQYEEVKTELKAIRQTLTEYLVEQAKFSSAMSSHRDAFDRMDRQIKKIGDDHEDRIRSLEQSMWKSAWVPSLITAIVTAAAVAAVVSTLR